MSLPLVERARSWPERLAIVAPEGVFTYADLLRSSEAVARALLAGEGAVAPGGAPRPDLAEARIAFLAPPGWDYVVVQWGIWRAGGIAVPLAVSHPLAELRYTLEDSGAEAVVAHPDFLDRVEPLARELGIACRSSASFASASGAGAPALPQLDLSRRAMILYTSGTTGRPKGVVSTHGNLEAQMASLVEAWKWTERDHILLTLPLHHVHGIVNVLGCALRSGATCQILPAFDAGAVWERIARGDLTLYMAVPTLYRRLIEAWEKADSSTRARWSEGARALRLMVSGSAALPVPTLERWEEITGHRLLERYGMTEIGMALSNPLDGERRPGFVGTPLPGVEVRLVQGEIQVRGPTVFRGYWERPRETAEAFTEDGWFRTGDVATVEDGSYRILGRASVDILKTGGEKVSALEIEDVLRGMEGVADCAVVGVPDAEWGERVCAAIVPGKGAGEGTHPTPEAVRAFAKERLAPYKVPKTVLVVDELPRNAMGKVTKPEVRKLFA